MRASLPLYALTSKRHLELIAANDAFRVCSTCLIGKERRKCGLRMKFDVKLPALLRGWSTPESNRSDLRSQRLWSANLYAYRKHETESKQSRAGRGMASNYRPDLRPVVASHVKNVRSSDSRMCRCARDSLAYWHSRVSH